MRLNEIKAVARQHHIKVSSLTKKDLIRAIQHAEGNSPCYDSNISNTCGQDSCLWRKGCK